MYLFYGMESPRLNCTFIYRGRTS